MSEVKILYRYEREYVHYDVGELQARVIALREYKVWKTTPCGYWINKEHKFQKGKFVLSCKGTVGKRYAYHTKKLAWYSFKIRTQYSLMHSKRAVRNAEIFLEMVKESVIKRPTDTITNNNSLWSH